jgi:hypothetical protein
MRRKRPARREQAFILPPRPPRRALTRPAPLIPPPPPPPSDDALPLSGKDIALTVREPAAAGRLRDFYHLLLKGDVDGAAALLKRAPSLANAADATMGDSPLHAAVRAKSLPLVQMLVRAGADMGAVDAAGRTAAQAAAADGAAGMAAWLEGAAEGVAVAAQ